VVLLVEQKKLRGKVSAQGTYEDRPPASWLPCSPPVSLDEASLDVEDPLSLSEPTPGD
jgi:hypothetical protein